MNKKLQMGFLMDPMETINPYTDTTLVFMQEAQKRGHKNFYFTLPQLFLREGVPYGELYPIEIRRGKTFYKLGPKKIVPLHELDIVFMRKDPPFDDNYLAATYLLERIPSPTWVINNAMGLRNANEKLFALRFPKLVPEHLVSSDPQRILEFMNDVGGKIIVKPINSYAGRGIVYVDRADKNKHALLELTTLEGKQPILAQRYLPESRQGDKRIVLLNGEPIGTLLRIPSKEDYRGNLRAGGKPVKTSITRRDREICETLKPELQKEGLHFVGIDVIGGYLTEVNVTSPTGVQQINRLYNVRLEEQVLRFVESAYKPLT
ncbi:MAG: glutathione synthase [Deltaproteobacteria bacterium]|nr:glutathione synthase [Deltaproteobacteria bacterium]